MRHTKHRRCALGVLVTALLLAGGSVFAQSTEPDPAIQTAKEETAVVYDLGRFFGYVATMEQENPDLSLSRDQLKVFYEAMRRIATTNRIEPDWAAETLEALELEVLDPKQLMEVDMLALARQETRLSSGSGTGTGQGQGGGASSGGTSPMQSYIAGGDFNPITSQDRSLGEGFYELLKSIQERLNS